MCAYEVLENLCGFFSFFWLPSIFFIQEKREKKQIVNITTHRRHRVLK